VEKEIGQYLTDDQAMVLAIQCARAGAPYVSPNPLVGCVVLNSKNELVSSGYHEKYGEAHAEINAIKNLTSNDLIDSKIFVTLEPCAHQGKTGSCAKKLSEYKIGKVIYGLVDPNPLVAGQGAQILKDADIPAEEYQGKFKQDLEDLAEVFLKNFRQKKTFVAMKVATSLDGQMALKTGESQWITGAESREFVHELRSWYDAIVVGYNTVEVDNPSLNIRHPKITKSNKLIVLDPRAQILKNVSSGKKYKFLDAYSQENIYFAVSSEVSSEYQTIAYSDLDNLMNKIWNLNIKSIFIEGGAKTYSSFLAASLVDRIHLFMNASIIGNQNGLSWTSGFGVKALSDKLILKNSQTKIFGSDIYITGKI
jgi:diaminohydroxyphosphoribosylaminopyrimidine deaminase/5-amino-6-(5-phosphoribosylamino)uracil reductase